MKNPCASNVNIACPECVGFDEVTAGFDFVAHEHGEDAVGFDGVVDLDAQEAAHCRVHGGFPELGRVHLTQAFVALTAGGAFGLGDEPLHGLAEVRHAFFFLTLAVAA